MFVMLGLSDSGKSASQTTAIITKIALKCG